jgi:DNA-binding transcriptional MocR family regulator
MADNTEFRRDLIRGWCEALNAVRAAGASSIAVPVNDMAIILDAATQKTPTSKENQ